MVEMVRCEGEVAGLIPVDRVVHENWLRVVTLVEWGVADRWGLFELNFFKFLFLKSVF